MELDRDLETDNKNELRRRTAAIALWLQAAGAGLASDVESDTPEGLAQALWSGAGLARVCVSATPEAGAVGFRPKDSVLGRMANFEVVKDSCRLLGVHPAACNKIQGCSAEMAADCDTILGLRQRLLDG